MISSTVEDMVDEREAAEAAIRTFRFTRFRSEMVPAVAGSPRDVVRASAQECDVFLLLLGSRYGWIPPDDTRSVTEFEFDEARGVDPGKILVFVKDVPAEEREVAMGRFVAKATDYRAGYFRPQPFQNPAELREQVEESLSLWVSGKIRAAGIAPENLGTTLPVRHPGYLLGGALVAVLVGAVLPFGVLDPAGLVRGFAALLDHSRWAPAAASTAARALLAFMVGVGIPVLGYGLLYALIGPARPLLLFLAGVAGTFGALGLTRAIFWGFQTWQILLPAALVVGAGTLALLARSGGALEDERKATGIRPLDATIVLNAVTSPLLPSLLPVAALAVFLSETLFVPSGLGGLLLAAQRGARPGYVTVAFLALVTIIGLGYFAIRWLQLRMASRALLAALELSRAKAR